MFKPSQAEEIDWPVFFWNIYNHELFLLVLSVRKFLDLLTQLATEFTTHWNSIKSSIELISLYSSLSSVNKLRELLQDSAWNIN